MTDEDHRQTLETDTNSEAGNRADPHGAPLASEDEKEPDIQEATITISGQWGEFVQEVAHHANISLVSLLRNSVVLELSEKKLIIGYQNLQVFTQEKRTTIETIAREFFNESIEVVFEESDHGLDDSLRVKHNNAKAKAIEETREEAKNDHRILEILKKFPDAEIDEITILNDKEQK
ncbi:hypothetical protein KKI24_21320 [bacterium]|nr:hypothetical protein [bacterium]